MFRECDRSPGSKSPSSCSISRNNRRLRKRERERKSKGWFQGDLTIPSSYAGVGFAGKKDVVREFNSIRSFASWKSFARVSKPRMRLYRDDPHVWKSPQGSVPENRGRVFASFSLALSFFFFTFFSHPIWYSLVCDDRVRALYMPRK